MNQETPKIQKKWIFPHGWVIGGYGLNTGGAMMAFFLTALGVWIYSGMVMFSLLIATSPATMAFESAEFDYAVWWTILGLILGRVIWVLGTIRPMTGWIFFRTLAFLWLYWAPMYGVLMFAAFMLNKVWMYQILMVGIITFSIWFFKNLRTFVIKEK